MRVDPSGMAANNDGWAALGQALAIVAALFDAVFKLVFGNLETVTINGSECINAPDGFALGLSYSTGDVSGNGILFIPPSEAKRYIKRAEGSNTTLSVVKTAFSAAVLARGGYLIGAAVAAAPMAKILLKIGITPLASKVIGGLGGFTAGLIFDSLIQGNAEERIGAMKLCAQNGSGFVLTKNGVYEWSPRIDRGYGMYPYIKLDSLSR
jgi:hypothetical protein